MANYSNFSTPDDPFFPAIWPKAHKNSIAHQPSSSLKGPKGKTEKSSKVVQMEVVESNETSTKDGCIHPPCSEVAQASPATAI